MTKLFHWCKLFWWQGWIIYTYVNPIISKMSTLRYIWHNTQPLSLLLRRYIGWVASSLALALFLYIPFNLLPITPNLFNLWLAISILIIQPVLHQLSKKVLRIKVININTGVPAGPIRSFLRNLPFFIPPFNLIDCLTNVTPRPT